MNHQTTTYTEHIANQPRYTKYDTDAIKAHNNYKSMLKANKFRKQKTDWMPIIKMLGMILLCGALLFLMDYILKNGGI